MPRSRRRPDRRRAAGGCALALLAALAAVVMAALPGDAARAQSPLTLEGAFTLSNEGARVSYPYVAGHPLSGADAPRWATPPRLPAASGGSGAYRFALTLANVQTGAVIAPADLGLTFDGSANPPALAGAPCDPAASPTPSACPIEGFAGFYRATLTVTDAATPPASVSVTAPLVIEADSAPSLAAGSASHRFAVDRREAWRFPAESGGNTAYNDGRYRISAADAEALKAVGLRLQASTGHVYGTPTGALTRNVALTVTDRDGDSATMTLRITVATDPAPRFTRDRYRILWYDRWQAGEGWPYAISPVTWDKRAPLPGAGGPATTAYALTGTLPAGITYDAAANELRGAARETGTFDLTLTATSGPRPPATTAITLVVTTAPEPVLYSWPLTCTRVQIRVSEGYASNVLDPDARAYRPALEPVTGWRVQAKRRGADAWETLHANLPPDRGGFTTIVHDGLEPGSSWSYRVAAITASGQGEWSAVSRAPTTHNWADPRGRRAIEAGMTLTANPFTVYSGRQAANVRWQRADDAASPVWTDVASDGGFHTVTADDAGKLFRALWDVVHDLEPDLWAHDLSPNLYGGGVIPVPPHTVALGQYHYTDPAVADDAPAFATPSLRVPPRAAGEPVFIQLPVAAGGSAPLTYTLTPALPAGLTFDAATLVISGAPAADWTGSHTLTATDADCDQAALAVEVAPPTVAVTLEARVWQHVDDGARLFLSARPAGGSWATLGTVPLSLDRRSGPDGQWAYGQVTLDAPLDGGGETPVTITVVRDTASGALYLNARASGGSWSDPGPIALPLDDGYSRSGRYRYGDATLTLPAPAP